MDTPLWVTVLVAVLTAGATYLAGVRPARIAAREAAADRDLARQVRDDDREQWLVDRIDRAWELCRSPDEHDKRAGVRMLRALVQEPRLSRLVSTVLDEVAQEELGAQLRDLRADWATHGRLPDVDVVVVGDGRQVRRRRARVSASPRARQVEVRPWQAELALAAVEARRAAHRSPDPLLAAVAAAADSAG